MSNECRFNRWAPLGASRIAAALVLSVAVSAAGHAADDLEGLLEDGKPILDVRYRLESVDQAGRVRDATAHTARVRAGYETGRINGIGGAFDVEWVETIGDRKFNDTVNVDARYPVVADPDDLALNQLYLIADGTIPKTRFKLGRQRVIWDNARFIGNVGFRQNEQTFDAGRISTTLLPDSTLEYLYMEKVHRIFGRDSAAGRLDLAGHGLRAQYRGFDGWRLTPFALLLDYDRAAVAANSTATYGLWVTGKRKFGDGLTGFLGVGVSNQKDRGNNAGSVDLWYYHLEPALGYRDWRFIAGFEQLNGDGATGFRTPLATLHKFNGITDQFLATPAGGLRDLYAKVKTTLPAIGGVGGIKFGAAYHRFTDDDGSVDFGDEWNAGISKAFPTSYGRWIVGLQYADYGADTFAADIDKLWVTVGFKL
ncbi:MAG: hypothetical protein QF582_23195 [Alphaproteobacteria bacterium]|jgi:hypothetical protein|nr:hypothetical protein [Alphaproteobacteria bacterium]